MTNQNNNTDRERSNHHQSPQVSLSAPSTMMDSTTTDNGSTDTKPNTTTRPLHTTTTTMNTTSSSSSTTSPSGPNTPPIIPPNVFSSSSSSTSSSVTSTTTSSAATTTSRSNEAMKQLFCGGLAGSVAKTVTAPFSRLTILFQVHSMVTTNNQRPQFASNMYSGILKIIERGGIIALWRGNMTSVLHRFPYSAINFYVYENTLDILSASSSSSSSMTTTTTPTNNKLDESSSSLSPTPSLSLQQQQQQQRLCETIRQQDEQHETSHQLVRRLSKMVFTTANNHHHEEEDYDRIPDPNDNTVNDATNSNTSSTSILQQSPTFMTTTTISNNNNNNNSHNRTNTTGTTSSSSSSSSAVHKFIAGAVAGVTAVTMCYPLDLVRTRLSTELEGYEHYRGITDAFLKIYKTEGIFGFYSGIVPTLFVAVPNFAISYTTYGTLKEYMIDDDLFYNLRRIDTESGEKSKLGFLLTVACGAASGILATLITFPMDTIRRRMQVQNLHVPIEHRMTSVYQQLYHMIHHEGLISLYRGLTPELIKVVPMVGTMFFVYERTKEFLNVNQERNHNHHR